MIYLYAGSAYHTKRRSFLENADDNTLFVVPTDVDARSLRLYFDTDTERSQETPLPNVIDLEGLCNAITEASPDVGATIDENLIHVVTRQTLEETPEHFKYLVGEHSVGRLSNGLLSRIVDAMLSLQRNPELEDSALSESVRVRQLRDLWRRVEARLRESRIRMSHSAQLEILTGMSEGAWSSLYPQVRHIIVMDFTSYPEYLFKLIAAVGRFSDTVSIMLDYDPEGDSSRLSVLDSVYPRFYEMSDEYVLDDDGPGEPEELTLSSVAVQVSSVAEEIRHAVAVTDQLHADGASTVIALPNWNRYALAVKRELENYGLTAEWETKQSVLRSPEWLLLERLSLCSVSKPDAQTILQFTRTPLLKLCLPAVVDHINGWEVSGFLELLLKRVGKVEGWDSLLNLLKERTSASAKEEDPERISVDEPTERGNAASYVRAIKTIVDQFGERRTIATWADLLQSFLQPVQACMASAPNTEKLSLQVLCGKEIRKALKELSENDRLWIDKPVRFSYFISVLRTALHRSHVNNSPALSGHSIVVCGLETAAALRKDCCIVLGCNDGSLPRFPRPEVNLVGRPVARSQALQSSRQMITLRKLLHNHRRTLLWMPKYDSSQVLLPSQIVEDLSDDGFLTMISAEELTGKMALGRKPLLSHYRNNLIDNLKGIVLSPGEIARFSLRGSHAEHLIHGLTVQNARSSTHLTAYDGTIVDEQLNDWLRRWTDSHIFSVSQLDGLVGCSFRFFLERILHTVDQEAFDELLSPAVLGSIVHDILAEFYRDWVNDGGAVPQFEEELEARELLARAYNRVIEKEVHRGSLSVFAQDLLTYKLFGDLEKTGFENGITSLSESRNAGILGQFLLMEMRRSDLPEKQYFKPMGFEVAFGLGEGLDGPRDQRSIADPVTLQLGQNASIQLRGSIDRIDLSAGGEFVVTDYKTGYPPEKRHILQGYRTQLPVYSLVAPFLLTGLSQTPEPAGGMYYSLRRNSDPKVKGEFFRKIYAEQAGLGKRTGVDDDTFFDTIEQVLRVIRISVDTIRQGRFVSTWRDPDVVCRFCEYANFCYKNVERTQSLIGLKEDSTPLAGGEL